jgi:hypothetical protein
MLLVVLYTLTPPTISCTIASIVVILKESGSHTLMTVVSCPTTTNQLHFGCFALESSSKISKCHHMDRTAMSDGTDDIIIPLFYTATKKKHLLLLSDLNGVAHQFDSPDNDKKWHGPRCIVYPSSPQPTSSFNRRCGPLEVVLCVPPCRRSTSF